MPDVDRLQLLALAYNAGPVTVAKALQYAAEAGRPQAWREAEYYKRALLFTGAYSTSQAARNCLPKATAAEREARIREAEAVRKKHKVKQKWRTAPDPPQWTSVGPTLPAFVQCAIDFKHRNSPRYAAKILAYRDRFRTS
jgi:hypothetical protein